MMQPFIYPIKVHIEDTDFAGVVYHSNYLNFFERARSEWAEQMGMGMHWQREHGLFLPVCAVDIQFLYPVRVHEIAEVVTRIEKIGRASFLFDQCLRMADTPDKLCCKAVVKVACVNQAFQPRALPNDPVITRIRENYK